jgi:hypothetical protein
MHRVELIFGPFEFRCTTPENPVRTVLGENWY